METVTKPGQTVAIFASHLHFEKSKYTYFPSTDFAGPCYGSEFGSCGFWSSGAHFIHFVDANDQTWLENHHHIIITSKPSTSSTSRIWKTSGAAPQPPLFASRSLNSRLNDSADAAGMIPLKLARIRYGKRSLIHALDFRLDHPTQRSPGNVASCCCKKDETCKHAVLCSFLKGFRPGNVGKSPKIEQCFHPLSN